MSDGGKGDDRRLRRAAFILPLPPALILLHCLSSFWGLSVWRALDDS